MDGRAARARGALRAAEGSHGPVRAMKTVKGVLYMIACAVGARRWARRAFFLALLAGPCELSCQGAGGVASCYSVAGVFYCKCKND